MDIYKATEKDIDLVTKVALQLWPEHTAADLAEELLGVIHSREGAIFILQEQESAIGFAQCQLRHDYVEGTDSSPVGYLEGIYVDQGYRHLGCAAKLIDRCEQWAKEQGCIEFASDCELENEVSLAFHLKMGFEETGRIICFTKPL